MQPKYMHILNGAPARFNGQQVVYLTDRCKNVLRDSLEEIKDDQKKSNAWRNKQGFTSDYRQEYVMFYV